MINALRMQKHAKNCFIVAKTRNIYLGNKLDEFGCEDVDFEYLLCEANADGRKVCTFSLCISSDKFPNLQRGCVCVRWRGVMLCHLMHSDKLSSWINYKVWAEARQTRPPNNTIQSMEKWLLIRLTRWEIDRNNAIRYRRNGGLRSSGATTMKMLLSRLWLLFDAKMVNRPKWSPWVRHTNVFDTSKCIKIRRLGECCAQRRLSWCPHIGFYDRKQAITCFCNDFQCFLAVLLVLFCLVCVRLAPNYFGELRNRKMNIFF